MVVGLSQCRPDDVEAYILGVVCEKLYVSSGYVPVKLWLYFARMHFRLQDEKNQILIASIWLNLVRNDNAFPHSAPFPHARYRFIYTFTRLISDRSI